MCSQRVLYAAPLRSAVSTNIGYGFAYAVHGIQEQQPHWGSETYVSNTEISLEADSEDWLFSRSVQQGEWR
jgi:hypothetical protein